MNILELFAHIGLKADQAPADRFLKTINDTKKQLIGAVAGTLSLATAIHAVNDAMADALGFKKFAAETGASVQELQKWQAIANEVSGSGQAVAESIKAIVSNQENIKLGKGNISGYALLGIDPRQDPFKILEQLRSKTQGLSQGMKKNILAQFGVSSELIPMLDLTNDAFEQMKRNAWIIPNSSIAGLDRARASIAGLNNMLKYFKTEIAARLAPQIEKITRAFQKWARENKEGIIKGIKTGLEWLGRFMNMVIRTGIVIDKIVRGTIGWKTAMIGIAAAFAIMNAGFLLSPIGMITAGIILLMAVLEDLYVYTKGGKSAIGHLAEGSPKLKKILDDMFSSFRDISQFFKDLKSLNFDDMVSKWGAWGMVLGGIRDALKQISDLISGILTGDWSKFMESWGINKMIDQMKEDSKNPIWSKEGFSKWTDEIKTDWNKWFPSAAPAAAGNVNITINGIEGADRVAPSVSDAVRKAQKDAMRGGKKE